MAASGWGSAAVSAPLFGGSDRGAGRRGGDSCAVCLCRFVADATRLRVRPWYGCRAVGTSRERRNPLLTPLGARCTLQMPFAGAGRTEPKGTVQVSHCGGRFASEARRSRAPPRTSPVHAPVI